MDLELQLFCQPTIFQVKNDISHLESALASVALNVQYQAVNSQFGHHSPSYLCVDYLSKYTKELMSFVKDAKLLINSDG